MTPETRKSRRLRRRLSLALKAASPRHPDPKTLEEFARPVIDAIGSRRLVLHIGAPKTATSAIQHTLWANRQLLLNDGILYPSNVLSEVDPKHQYLVNGMRRNRPDGLAAGLAISALESRADTRAVVLSAEGMYFHWPRFTEPARRFLATVTSAVPTHVIVALRNRVEFLQSMYKQALENPPVDEDWGLAMPIEEFARRTHITQILDYRQQLLEIEALTGASMTILPYGQLVVDDFLNAIGVSELARGGMSPVVAANPSLSNDAAQLLRLFLQCSPSDDRREEVVARLHRMSAGIEGDPLVTEALADELKVRYEGVDLWIRERFGISV